MSHCRPKGQIREVGATVSRVCLQPTPTTLGAFPFLLSDEAHSFLPPSSRRWGHSQGRDSPRGRCPGSEVPVCARSAPVPCGSHPVHRPQRARPSGRTSKQVPRAAPQEQVPTARGESFLQPARCPAGPVLASSPSGDEFAFLRRPLVFQVLCGHPASPLMRSLLICDPGWVGLCLPSLSGPICWVAGPLRTCASSPLPDHGHGSDGAQRLGRAAWWAAGAALRHFS